MRLVAIENSGDAILNSGVTPCHGLIGKGGPAGHPHHTTQRGNIEHAEETLGRKLMKGNPVLAWFS